MTNTTETVRGLRALADLLEANPHLSSPFHHCDETSPAITHYIGWTVEDKKAELRNWARATSHLRPSKSYDDYANLTVDFGGGVVLCVYAQRSEVCERVVTGTEEVTKTIPDPEALKAVPTVEVTETVETVEWICKPFLAESEVPA